MFLGGIAMWQEFKKFAFRGNMIDLAVGVMIGGAVAKIVSSLVNDLFMPLISLLTGSTDVSTLFIALDGGKYLTIADAQTAGAATQNYGLFISTVNDFFLMAVLCVHFVKILSKQHKKPKPSPKSPPVLPVCKMQDADRRSGYALPALPLSQLLPKDISVLGKNFCRISHPSYSRRERANYEDRYGEGTARTCDLRSPMGIPRRGALCAERPYRFVGHKEEQVRSYFEIAWR